MRKSSPVINQAGKTGAEEAGCRVSRTNCFSQGHAVVGKATAMLSLGDQQLSYRRDTTDFPCIFICGVGGVAHTQLLPGQVDKHQEAAALRLFSLLRESERQPGSAGELGSLGINF